MYKTATEIIGQCAFSLSNVPNINDAFLGNILGLDIWQYMPVN